MDAKPHLATFAEGTRDWLYQHCNETGFFQPTKADLIRMGADGRFPNEARASVATRLNRFMRDAADCGSYAPTPLARLKLWLNKKFGRRDRSPKAETSGIRPRSARESPVQSAL
jgi:hypothetical protein